MLFGGWGKGKLERNIEAAYYVLIQTDTDT